MRIVYLPSTRRDLSWFRYYYRAVFPEGDARARDQFKATQALLGANPYVGRPAEDHSGVHELPILRTPFLLIYRVTDAQIEVLRLWDTRQGGTY